jgi:uncharacterized membrane protein
LLPVLPVLGAGVVVLLPLPEPMPVELGDVGLVVLPLVLEPEPLVLPEAPLPALEPLRASRSHFSLSAPVMARHLLASPPDAPDAAPAEPEVEPLVPEDEPVEGVAEGVELLPAAPAPVLPDDDAPLLPLLEPEDCENATPDSARSAAAVAAVSVFNIIERSPSKGGWKLRRLARKAHAVSAEKIFGARAECARWWLPPVARGAYCSPLSRCWLLGSITPQERNLPLPDITRKGTCMEKIEKSIEVAAPVRAVYNQWTQFEEFPRFMAGVKEVRQLDDTHLHWHAEIWGKDKEWDAEITEQVPDQVIAWRSTSGAPNAGTVRFEPVSHERTRVRLTMEYQPEGAVEKTGDAVGVFSSRVQNSVEDFKKFIEKRGAETGGWRGEVHGGQKTPTSQRQGPGGSR